MKKIAPAIIFLILAASAVAAEPKPPIQDNSSAKSARWGRVEFSDGTSIEGKISTTNKPIRILDDKKSTFRDIRFEKIAAIEQAVKEEWDEREWRWAESGNDEKIYTGRVYRAAEFTTAITLKSGEKITGLAVAPIRVQTKDKLHRLEIHERFKNQPVPKDEIKPLVYIRRLTLMDEPPAETEPAEVNTKDKQE